MRTYQQYTTARRAESTALATRTGSCVSSFCQAVLLPLLRRYGDYCDAPGISAVAPSPIGVSVVRRRMTRAMASGLKAPW